MLKKAYQAGTKAAFEKLNFDWSSLTSNPIARNAIGTAIGGGLVGGAGTMAANVATGDPLTENMLRNAASGAIVGGAAGGMHGMLKGQFPTIFDRIKSHLSEVPGVVLSQGA